MRINKILMVCFVLLLNINISNASTGSGNLLIQDNSEVLGYQISTGAAGGGSANFTRLYIYNTNFNNIQYFETYDYTGDAWDTLVFSKDTDATSFTCVAPNSCSGYFAFSKALDSFTYTFISMTFVQNPIDLIFTDSIQSSITINFAGNRPTSDLSASKPVCMANTIADKCHDAGGNFRHNASVDALITATYTYELIDDTDTFYHITVDKLGTISTKVSIESVTGSIYNRETTFNTVDYDDFREYTNGVVLNYSISAGDKQTVVIASGSGGGGGISGNVTTNKQSYNQSETMLINYTLSDSSTYSTRIQIAGYVDTNIIYQTSNLSTSGNLSYYIPLDIPIQEYAVYIQYYDNGWYTLDYKDVNIYPKNRVSITLFSSDSYDLGNLIHTISFSNSTGYIILLDSNDVVKFNFSISGNTTTYYDYYLMQEDLIGTWTLELYNSSGSLLSTDTTIINFAIIRDEEIAPIPTTQGNSLLDIGNEISIVVLGNMDSNNDGVYSDDETLTMGYKFYMVIALLCVLLAVAGTYYAIKNKRRK